MSTRIGAHLDLPSAVCVGGPGWGFDVDYGAGKLVFVDVGSYTIPNRCIRFVDGGAYELAVATFDGDDAETVNGRVAYPRVETKRVARVTCELLFSVDPEGNGWEDIAEGMHRNLLDLRDLSAYSLLGTGLQTIQWTPWVGATTYTFEAHVLPPILSDVKRGLGGKVGFTIEAPTTVGLP